MKLEKKSYHLITRWMFRNARPLELALFNYHFEQGTKQDVLNYLAAFQNSDGGFGHALEADSWNPNSSPMQTWCATEVLLELVEMDAAHPIIQGILSYLDHCDDFSNGLWQGTILSNNDYPHAFWWEYNDTLSKQWQYNPTACLAGFILYFADKDSSIYQKAEQIAIDAVKWYLSSPLFESMHESFCFVRLFQYCQRAEKTDLFDMDLFEQKLRVQVKNTITQDKARWMTDYICKPSQFFNSSNSIFYPDNQGIAEYEASFILNSINEDGVWDITWQWDRYPSEWAISHLWWQSKLVLSNLQYLKGLDYL